MTKLITFELGYRSVCFFVLSMLLSSPNLLSQKAPHKCGVQDLTQQQMDFYKSHVNDIKQHALHSSNSQRSVEDVPVFFTVFSDDDGLNTVSQSKIDTLLNGLNQVFTPLLDVNFVQCDDIQYIYNSKLFYGPSIEIGYYKSYSYIGTGLNIYIKAFGASAAYPCLDPSDPSAEFDCDVPQSEQSSILGLSIGDQGLGIVNIENAKHEIGHSFGLLHTFHGNNNHLPYVDPNPRELVIRDTNNNLTYPYPNCHEAGDLLCDTPTDCSSFDFGQCNEQNCIYGGIYTDLNGDSLDNPLMDNYMSYHSCRTSFTTGQIERMQFYRDSVRSIQYDPSYCGSLVDYVEFEGTSQAMRNVVINFSTPFSPYAGSCNAITDDNGRFKGVLVDSFITALFVRKISSTRDLGEPYALEDWNNGVSALDILIIQRHILAIDSLESGYKLIAADVNQSGTVSTLDLLDIRKLILAINEDFPQLSDPWLFVPEYIPQDYPSAFHADPFESDFNNNPNDTDYPNYLNPFSFWYYTTLDGTNGKNGFDGIKAGDVTGNADLDLTGAGGSTICAEDVLTTIPNFNIDANDTIEIDVTVKKFQNISAFQLGMYLSNDYFEFIDLESGDLADFSKSNNSGLTKLEKDELRVLWWEPNADSLSLNDNESIFKLLLKAKQTFSTVSDAFNFQDSILENVFYFSNGCEADVELIINTQKAKSRSPGHPETVSTYTTSFNCYPNPFKDELNLQFELLEPSDCKITIQDTNGSLIKSVHSNFKAGKNNHLITDTREFPKGILFVKIETKQAVMVEKILKL